MDDSYAIWKVKTTKGIGNIFGGIDANRAKLLRLASYRRHKEDVKEYVESNQQPKEEKCERFMVWEKLRRMIEPHIRDGKKNGYLALGGSTLSKLTTTGADLDLCFAVRCTNGEYEEEGVNKHVLTRIMVALNKQSDLIRKVRYIDARVPLLQLDLCFPYHEIKVDINCNCVAGIYNSHLLFYYAKIDERFVEMNIILKEWAKKNNVVDPRYGKLNSYTISLMIIHFLQSGVSPPILPNLYALFPQHFRGTVDVENLDYGLKLRIPPIPENDRSVGELIYGFFEYFSRFKYNEWAISIKEGAIYPRSTQPPEDAQFLFFLEEAYDGMTVPKNLTEPYKMNEILMAFKHNRGIILADLYGGPDNMPDIDTSHDYHIVDMQKIGYGLDSI